MVLCAQALAGVSSFNGLIIPKCIACIDVIDQMQINGQRGQVMALNYVVCRSDDSHSSLKTQRHYVDVTKNKVHDNLQHWSK